MEKTIFPSFSAHFVSVVHVSNIPYFFNSLKFQINKLSFEKWDLGLSFSGEPRNYVSHSF